MVKGILPSFQHHYSFYIISVLCWNIFLESEYLKKYRFSKPVINDIYKKKKKKKLLKFGVVEIFENMYLKLTNAAYI